MPDLLIKQLLGTEAFADLWLHDLGTDPHEFLDDEDEWG